MVATAVCILSSFILTSSILAIVGWSLLISYLVLWYSYVWPMLRTDSKASAEKNKKHDTQ